MKNVMFDEKLAEKLYMDCLSDTDIASAVHADRTSIAKWRKRKGYETNHGLWHWMQAECRTCPKKCKARKGEMKGCC